MLLIYFIFGSTIGSFLCLVAERTPLKKSIITPASHCTYCHKQLHYFELIPLFSIILQKFRCRSCNKKISPVYFFSELICGSLFLYSLATELTLFTVYRLVLLLMAFSLSLTDIYYWLVEPKILYSSTLLVCVLHFFLALPFYYLTSIFLFCGLSIFNLRGKENLGGGDIILISIWACLFEFRSLLFLLFTASGTALIFCLFFKYILKTKLDKLPFVPFLSIGLFFTLHFS